MRPDWKAVCPVLAAVLLSACQAPAPRQPAESQADAAPPQTEDLETAYRALAAGGGAVYTVNPADSKVLIYIFRGGLAAKSGHNHVLRAASFEGYVHLPSDDPTQARFDLRVPVDDLVVDEPVLRTETGGNFSGERSQSDIEGTRRNMSGERGLNTAQFPFVNLKSLAVAGDWPILVADVAVSLHGVTRQQPVMLRVQRGNGALKVSGTLVLRQSDYGITPYSLFGGVIAVQDAVAIEFELVARTPADASL